MGSVGKAAGNFFNDALTIGTAGLVDAKKGRVYVPFSGASARAGAKAVARSNSDLFSAFTGTPGKINDRRAAIDKAIDSPEGRTAGQVAATLSALGTGYGAAGALGASATGAQVAAGGAGLAAQGINQVEAEKHKITTAEDAQREMEKQKADALKQAEDAKLAVQTREAEERRRRSGKQAQTVLTGFSGLGGQAPSYTQTLSPGTARKSVLG